MSSTPDNTLKDALTLRLPTPLAVHYLTHQAVLLVAKCCFLPQPAVERLSAGDQN